MTNRFIHAVFFCAVLLVLGAPAWAAGGLSSILYVAFCAYDYAGAAATVVLDLHAKLAQIALQLNPTQGAEPDLACCDG